MGREIARPQPKPLTGEESLRLLDNGAMTKLDVHQQTSIRSSVIAGQVSPEEANELIHQFLEVEYRQQYLKEGWLQMAWSNHTSIQGLTAQRLGGALKFQMRWLLLNDTLLKVGGMEGRGERGLSVVNPQLTDPNLPLALRCTTKTSPAFLAKWTCFLPPSILCRSMLARQ